jgi:hypothetical protein
MKQFLSGKKTYIIAGLMVLIGLVKWLVGDITLVEFITSDDIMIVLGGFGLGSLRAGVKKSGVNIILILLLPLVFMGCSTSAYTFESEIGLDLTNEPQQLAEIVDAVYAGYEQYEINKGQKVDALALALELFTKLKTAVNGSELVLIEITSLTDYQIISLANLGDNYQLGNFGPKFKQVVKVALFLAQTYYLFKPVSEETTMLYDNGRFVMSNGRIVVIDGGWNELVNKRRIEKCLNGLKGTASGLR